MVFDRDLLDNRSPSKLTSEHSYLVAAITYICIMASPLRPGNSNMLKVGSYNFHMEGVEMIYNLYSYHNWTLWIIKERRFEKASIEQIAVAVSHGRMDKEKIPYYQRARFTYDSDDIDLSEFNVGHPTQ